MGTAGERHGNGRGTAWERHGMCESALRLPYKKLLQTTANARTGSKYDGPVYTDCTSWEKIT
jgi:hypothetical protein